MGKTTHTSPAYLAAVLCALLSLVLPSAAFAADPSGPSFMPNDPKRPVADISRDLGIEPEQFVACFEHVTPAPQGEHPAMGQPQANKAVLLPCLQDANPNITNESLDAVMDKYRPGGHEAQEPRP